MNVTFERDGSSDESFMINWPDSQLRFYLIGRDDKLNGVKEAVYVLMDKFRTKFYIGETGPSSSGGIKKRFQVHKWQKDFWNCALVVEDRNGEFKKQDIRKWFERRLYEIAKERSDADKKYEVLSRAGEQENLQHLENRIRDILSVCRFLGIPWGYGIVNERQNEGATSTRTFADRPSKSIAMRKPASRFTFDMVGVREGDELSFTEDDLRVKAKGSNEVVFHGETYSLTGFVRKFMPNHKRNKKDAYQGPAYFTFHGTTLTKLRAEHEQNTKATTTRIMRTPTKETCVMGLTRTQLARKIASEVDGSDGAANGIMQYFSKFKPCPKTGKWRRHLERVGIKFDEKDYVVDWSVAKDPL